MTFFFIFKPGPKFSLHLLYDGSMIEIFYSCSAAVNIMAIRVVEFSNGGYKIRKIFA